MTRVPVPFETSAPVRLELHLAQRTHVVASGRGLSVRFDGEANFEAFASIAWAGNEPASAI